jgi:hypothetical protein
MRHFFIALFLACMSGPAFAQQFRCSGAEFSPYPAAVSTQHDHRRYAPSARGLQKLFTAYFAVFDDTDDDSGDGRPDLRFNPEFVSYELRGVTANANGDFEEPDVSIVRPGSWYSSREFAPLIAAMPTPSTRRLDNSYDGIGEVWNRGHLTMSDHAQRISAEAACNTHHFWNASPQAEDLNQGPWRHLEDYSAAASNKYGRIWIIAGPIFDRATPRLTIGDTGEIPIEVPDAFFKVLVRDGASGPETLAFLFEQPNIAGAPGRPQPAATWINCNRARAQNHTYDHRARLVSIAQIEARTGMRFFRNRPNRQALVNARATQLWPVETRYWDPRVCAGQRGHP